MLSAIFSTLTTAGQSFITFLTALLNNVVSIFYTAPSGSETTGSLTDIGILVIVGVATSFVFFCIRWLTKLVKLRG